jgi:hypothetical protein
MGAHVVIDTVGITTVIITLVKGFFGCGEHG